MNSVRQSAVVHGLSICVAIGVAACGSNSAGVGANPSAPSVPAATAAPTPAATSGAQAAAGAAAAPVMPAAMSGPAAPAAPTVQQPVPGTNVPSAGTTNPAASPSTSATTMPMGMASAGSAAPATPAAAGSGAPGGAPAMTGPDGFPKDEPLNLDQKGPHAFDKYTDGLDNPTYASSVMYYPTDATPPFAATVFSPGFTATKENYEMFLGPLLASHGIAILLTTPTTTGDFPQQRAEDLEAAVMQIMKENTREGSPLKGKLAVDRVCVTGHSMGGGGTLWAASSLGNKIRCAVPLQPWQPGQSFDKIVAPTMFIAAQSDNVAAVAQNAAVFYASIPNTVPKYYVEFAGASHFLTTNDLGMAYDVQSKYMIAFYKLYLEGDERYRDALNAPPEMAISKYEHTGK